MVRLDLVHADGRREQRVGPPVDTPVGFGRATRIGLLPVAGYAVGVGLGLCVGAAAGGSTGAAAGAVAGFAIAWLVLTILGARWRVRSARRNKSPGSPPNPGEGIGQ